MTNTYNADRVGCQRLIALCNRNFSKFDKTDKKIVQIELRRFYGSGKRGQKEKLREQI